MAFNFDRKKQASVLRIFRKVHRLTGASLFILFFFISITGILLGWKKNSNNYLLSKTYEGSSSDFNDWLTLDSLETLAYAYIISEVDERTNWELDRIDVRKSKGSVKFLFNKYYGLQIDGSNGKLLTIERRRADFVEHIHDGSIMDRWAGTDNIFKLFYTSITGIALLTFTITGFWLWYGPIRMRRNARK